MTKYVFVLYLVFIATIVLGKEYQVSTNGNDSNDGSVSSPLKTISKAAKLAQPGDVITVHKGTYRERINPPRGGKSDDKRIVYQAAEGEEVWIKGSEIIKNWTKVEGSVWKVSLPNSFFGDYNPYKVILEGDWFDGRGRDHHTGEVFLNGKSLFEKDSLEKVLNPKVFEDARDPKSSLYTWYCESDNKTTTIWVNFHDHNPNEELVEISVRPACFYPDKPGRNYITLKGFHISQAATQWAPPTAEQIGMIGTHWSKGWIIEDNEISNSKCSGITLGKDRATGQNVWSNDRSKGGDIHYNEVIVRALIIGWSKENIGSHIVRNNTIFDCEQTGMCGSLGAAFSQIYNNNIYDIWTKRQFRGAEIAGIKIHAAIDLLVKNNRLANCGRGMWMDWMAQGTRITGNLCYENTIDDFFAEVNHGPYLVDNNIFLSETAIHNWSEGGAYVHNLICGFVTDRPSERPTPFHKAHSTVLAGKVNIINGDDRFYNNIFIAGETPIPEDTNPNERQRVGYGLSAYEQAPRPMHVDGNIYFGGAQPFSKETNFITIEDFDPLVKTVEKEDGVYLELKMDTSVAEMYNTLVTTQLLGKTVISQVKFENLDGTPLSIDIDYFGKHRQGKNPASGPFESLGSGSHSIKVW